MTTWNKPSIADQMDAILAGKTVEIPVTEDAARLSDGNAERLEALHRSNRSTDLLSVAPTDDPVAAFATLSTTEAAPVQEQALPATGPAFGDPADAPATGPAFEDPATAIEESATAIEESVSEIEKSSASISESATSIEKSTSAVSESVDTSPAEAPAVEVVDSLLAKPAKRAKETKEERKARLDREKPIVGFIGTQKMVHGEMVLNGICSKCVRCGMKLTDSVSIERGMGPECSSKGYSENPLEAPDEMGAMIELSAWPELVDFLVKYYKPHGVRGLMNGLVRIAALNRKTAVHGACASAIDQLGYTALSKALRDSLAVVSIKESTKRPGFYEVWVKKTEYKREWFDQVTRIPGFTFVKRGRFGKGMNLIPITQKRHLWYTLLTHYEGLVAKTPSGAVKIARPKKAA